MKLMLSFCLITAWTASTANAQDRTFLHAFNGDFVNQAFPDTIINYLDWLGDPWTAKINGTTFTHAPAGDFSQSHQAPVINYRDWAGLNQSAQIVGNHFLVGQGGDFSQAQHETSINYREWGSNPYSAQLIPLTVDVSLPSLSATYNQALSIPVSITEADGIISAELTVEYDTALLTLVGANSTGALSDGWSVETNTAAGSGTLEQLIIAMATDQSTATGAQTLIYLDFTVNNVRTPPTSALSLSNVLLNDGTPNNLTIDGLVTLIGNDGTISSAPATFITREDLTITVVDIDADLDGIAGNDQVSVVATNLNNGDIVNLTLGEDAATVGTFSSIAATEFGLAAIVDGILQAQAGDVIEVSFSDALHATGSSPITRTAQSTALGGVDGVVEITRATQPGDIIYIKITDADLNTSFSTAETAQVIVTSSNGESETVTLSEVDADDEVFFGSLASTSGAAAGTNSDGIINVQKGDVLTVTYDDLVTVLGDQLDRTDTDQAVDPFGDADGNGQVQAFDAAQALLHVLVPHLMGLEEIQANVDLNAVATGITPFDASLILQHRVGLITVFPVQTAPADNHPQPTATQPQPKFVVETRVLTLEQGQGYLSLVADERNGLLAGDIVLTGIERAELAPELSEYLVAARMSKEGLRVVFAGAQGTGGAGEVLRLYGNDLGAAQIQRAQLNDGLLEARIGERAPSARPLATQLVGNWPNPFNPETAIRFQLGQSSAVKLEVFDALGQRVQTLVNASLSAGEHQVVWRGFDERGRSLSSGVYFYRLEAGKFRQTRQMMLVK